MKLLSVQHQGGYRLRVHFDDHTKGDIDLTELVQTGIFIPLQDIAHFEKAYTTGYSIAWSDELEIDALNVYCQITNQTLDSCILGESIYPDTHSNELNHS